MPKISDQQYLLRTQYRNASNLNARIQLHQKFGTNPYPWYRWVFDQFEAPATCQFLEVGCGPASFWLENISRVPADWTVTLTDFSPGMVTEAQQTLQNYADRFQFQQADVQMLPFDNASFDVVMANHMLYHVPDRQKAYAEIRRVLKPDGRLYAATNGETHMHEMHTLANQFRKNAYTSQERNAWFTLEGGLAELAEWFASVTVARYKNDLIVTDADLLVAYLASSKRLSEEELNQCAAHIKHKIEADGSIQITPSTGLFVAQRGKNGH